MALDCSRLLPLLFAATAGAQLSTTQWDGAPSPAFRVDTRESFGGRLLHGTVSLSEEEGAVSLDGEPLSFPWDTALEPDGWHTLASATATVSAAVLNDPSVAIECGRLQSNTTWTSNVLHLVRNWVVIPEGVTLNVTAGAVVKFTENTGIVIEDGGKLSVSGTQTDNVCFTTVADDTIGGDTDMTNGVPDAVGYQIIRFPSGIFEDNGWLEIRDLSEVPGYPEVRVNPISVKESGGMAYVPLTLTGSRNAPFSIDWAAIDGTAQAGDDFTAMSGTVSWNNTGEGTKYIEIPIISDAVTEGFESFTVRITAVRGGVAPQPEAEITIYDQEDYIPFESAAGTSADLRLDTRGDFGGRLAHGTVSLSEEEGAVSLDGEPLSFPWDTALEPDGWHALTSGAATVSVAVLNDPSVAIECGRLQSNTTWTSNALHLVRNWVVVPNGVTLTVSEGAIVKFTEDTGVIIEDGGRLNMIGTASGNVVFTTATDDTVGGDTDMATLVPVEDSYRIYKFPSGTFSDNGWLQTRHTTLLPNYPWLALNGLRVAEMAGAVYVPVSIASGSRSVPFSIDWEAVDGSARFGEDFTVATGTVSWNNTSEGTKYIVIPLVVDTDREGEETFTVRVSVTRGVICTQDVATVTVYDAYDYLPMESVAETAAAIRLDTRESFGGRLAHGLAAIGEPDGADRTMWDTTAEADGWHTLTSGVATVSVAVLNDPSVAIECGRLPSSTIWTSNVVHLVRNWVVVPNGVTLTVSEGAIVKFTEDTGIIIEDGGRLTVTGAAGADVIFTDSADDTAGGDTDRTDATPAIDQYRIYKFPSGTFTDNGWLQTRYSSLIAGYASLALHDADTEETSGTIYLPVTVEGSRSVAFSVDWQATDGTALLGADYTLASGSLSWNGTSAGTKYIAIPVLADGAVREPRTFTVAFTAVRGMNCTRGAATARIYDSPIPPASEIRLEWAETVESPDAPLNAMTDVFIHQIAASPEPLTYSALWQRGDTDEKTRARLTARHDSAAGATVLLEGEPDDEGVYPWNTADVDEGWYTLAHQTLGEDGNLLDETTARMLVLHSPVLHAGTLTTNEVWTASRVHLLVGTVYVPLGVGLVIEPGAVVKFYDGTALDVEMVNDPVSAAGVVFTHYADDEVGGDTNGDGDATAPEVNRYSLIGNIVTDETTQKRYLTQAPALMPTFNPPGGTTFETSLSVAVSSATDGAQIRYTLDDTDPTTNSALYASVLTLTETTTVKARAFKIGMDSSAVASTVFMRLTTVATPTFDPADGTSFETSLSVAVFSATDNAEIRYTFNGAEPTTNSALYATALTLTETTTVKAKAFKSGMAGSTVASATYTKLVPAATPTFNPVDGTTFETSLSVAVSSTTSGSQIRYTLDGTEPTTNSTLYASALTLTETTTIKARVFMSGLAGSAVASATYTKLVPAATPTFDPADGATFETSLSVAVSSATSGAQICYTLDGTEPTTNSTLYASALTLTETTTIKARAFKSGLAGSAVASATYTKLVPAATPTFNPVDGTTFETSLSVAVSSATSGATIRYTLDGSTPTTNSALYASALTLTETTTVKAKAFKSGMAGSAVASATYMKLAAPEPHIWYVDAAMPDDNGDGFSWGTAKQTIQAAVDEASADDTVMVTNGVYEQFSVSNVAITIRSVNGADVTVIDAHSSGRCVLLGDPESETVQTNTVLEGFTLQNGDIHYSGDGGGAWGGTLRNCILQNNRGDYGGGASRSALYQCTLTSNYAYYAGGGASGCLLEACLITANTAMDQGGGAADCSLNSCVITGNNCFYDGSGTYECDLTGCTVAGNISTSGGGGMSGGTAVNSIIWGNEPSSGSAPNYGGSAIISYSCSWPLPDGVGNIDDAPFFLNAEDGDYRLREGSPCVDTGNSVLSVDVFDFLGNARVQGSAVDMGACEGATSGYLVRVKVVGHGTVTPVGAQIIAVGGNLVIEAAQGPGAFLHFLTNGVLASTEAVFTWHGIEADGEVTAVFGPATLYVNSLKPDDVGDGLSWATAKHGIQAAIGVAYNGDIILVTNGVYEAIDTQGKQLAIRSVNGADATVIDGGNFARCAKLGTEIQQESATLTGFTLRNGYCYGSGAGVWGGYLSECVVTGNTVRGTGGGAAQAALSDCVLEFNTSDQNGGGADSCLMTNCIVRNNFANGYGGGAYGGTFDQCLIADNQSDDSGGGAYDAVLTDCRIAGNTSGYRGGGASWGTLTRCVVSDNTASEGGGTSSGLLYDCTILGNRARMGGGAHYSYLVNVTVAGNTVDLYGGGVLGGTQINCIVWSNWVYDAVEEQLFTDNYDAETTLNMTYSCTTPAHGGAGNIAVDPLFVNADGGDYSLAAGSPCLNAGNSDAVESAIDLAGNVRIRDAAVDMGAYERTEDATVSTPTFDPADGTTFEDSLSVEVSSDTSGAQIHYTLDGTEPTTNSALYASSLTLTETTTIKAKAFKSGHTGGAVASATYTKLVPAATPTFNPADGTTFETSISVVVSSATSGAQIRYTLDGAEPTTNSALYASALTLTETTPIKAKAFKSGLAGSAVASATYTRIFTLADAVDAPSLVFSTGGAQPWFVETTITHGVGEYAAQSGVIDHRQSSWIETSVEGAGTLSFWWKVSCEDDEFDDWDYVSVTVDGTEAERLDGEAEWRQVALTVTAGVHTVRWTYAKDRVVSEGQDSAWLDEVVWTPAAQATQTTPVPVPYAWLDEFRLASAVDYEAAALADTDRDGMSAWEEYVAGSSPTNSASRFLTRITFENGAPHLEWTPDLGTARLYTVEGKAVLADTIWVSPTNAASRFFRVKVKLP